MKTRLLTVSLVALVLLSACARVGLPGGLYVEAGDRGKAWLYAPNDTVVLMYVTRVAVSNGKVFVETRDLQGADPFGSNSCKYWIVSIDPASDVVSKGYVPERTLGYVKKKLASQSRYASTGSCL